MKSSFTRQTLWRKGIVSSNRFEELAEQGQAIVTLTDKQPNITTKPLPVVFSFTGEDKAYFMPKVGDRVIVLMDSQNEDGIILGSIYTKQNKPSANSDKHFVEFSDGTKIQYDKREKELTINCSGDIIIKSENQLTIDCEDNIRLDSEKDIILRAKCKIVTIEEHICED